MVRNPATSQASPGAHRPMLGLGGVGVGLPYPPVRCSPPPAGAPAFPAGRGLAVAVLVRAMPSPGGLGWE